MTKQDDFAKDIRAAATKAGNFKSIGDVIELPDKEDWNNVCRIINKYCKQKFPYEENGVTKFYYGREALVHTIATAKKERATSGYKYGQLTKDYNITSKDSSMRLIFELPAILVRAIEAVYPVMFTNSRHFAWFAKNFKTLRLPEKY
jgi:hypothetical protein